MNKFARPFYCALLFCICWSLACNTDTPIAIRPDLVERSNLGNILKADISATTDSTAGKTVNTYAASFLLLGKLKNLESRILLRFDPLPDTGIVVSAKLQLPADEATGQDGSFDATVHQVLSAWNQSTITWGDQAFPVQFNPVAMDTQQVTSAQTDTLGFDLAPALVASWLTSKDTDRDTAGVLIQAHNAGFIKQFYSRFNSVKQPYLELTTRSKVGDRDTTITTRRSATASVFVFQRQAALPTSRLYVGNGERYQSVLTFRLNTSQLDSIPKNATINRALLTLQIDATNTVLVDEKDVVYLSLYYAQKQYGLDTLQLATADSLTFIQSKSVSWTSTSIQFALTSLVQSWVLQPPNNYGYLYLLPDYPSLYLSRVAFYSRRAAEAQAPKLQIEYTTPPKVQ
ncbi:MAG: DNRLRE domain-containing protein [candidate division KSB1 bacterium]|nr:DNRLRE domain-containing protein [candidate division KSB1 bacterium]MDZ7301342.1 DNRLRE domain-containing protein [candidate division KSB1 bacterium]MDZ7310773.1 DNRLRE domain-containing protein [candidate division KSB1 bacterium]